jgi:uncharacterized protein (DUF983 family)
MVDQSVTDETGERPVKPALARGWRRRCPNCGSGPVFKGYLTVRDQCAVCGEELHHHRADDGPAWMTMLIVGHLMAPMLHITYETFEPEGWQMAIGLSLVFTLLSLYLLPRIKAMFIGFQWAKRMHGFGRSETAL